MLPMAFVPSSIILTNSPALAIPVDLRKRCVPNLDVSNIIQFTAGLRPYRHSGIRIEQEYRFNKTLIHNYGHGGSGITLSLGSAKAAVDLIHGMKKGYPIAVLGGGIIGLTTAHELSLRGYKVTMYSEKWHPEVTSSIAGGQWTPTLVGLPSLPEEKRRYERIIEDSFQKFSNFQGSLFGVSMIDNILTESSMTRQGNQPSSIQSLYFDKLPFDGTSTSGYLYRSWMIEPHIFLPALMNQLREWGVRFVTKKFYSDDSDHHSATSVSELEESILFNCLGLGAKKLLGDESLIPVRGRLIHLNPDRRIDYTLRHDFYMLPRRDAIVLGGSYDFGKSDLSMDIDQYSNILQNHRSFFGMSQPTLQPNNQNIAYMPIQY